VSERKSDFSVAVLAAGQGHRLGYPKCLMRRGDEYLLLDLLEQASGINPSEIIVILGAGENIIKPMLPQWSRIIVNHQWHEGMSSSIRLALKATNQKSSGVLLMSCDQILIRTHHLERITSLLPRYDSRTACIASSYNETFGIPCFIGAKHFSQFDNLHGDQGAKSTLKTLNPFLVPIEEAFYDVDTPDDLKFILQKKRALFDDSER
jgi:molybdenum cofactor cytidylyltransferase